MRKIFSNFFLNETEIDETFFSISPYHFRKIKTFIENYSKQSKKILMLYGETGVGKTFLVHYLAKKYEMELFELNPSNSLNKNNIHLSLEQATKQMSLFGNKKLIFIDEIDNFSSRHDRGYLNEVLKISKDSSFPIIVTVNNLYNTKLSKFRAKVEKSEIQTPTNIVMEKIAKKILQKNEFNLSDNILKSLIQKSQGDIRALTTDLFIFYCFSEDKDIDYNEILKDFLQLSMRKKDKSVYDSLKKITKKNENDFSDIQNLEETWDNLELWIEENIFKLSRLIDSKIYWNMFEYISTSDIFLKKIMRYQHWRYLVYISYFLTSGLNISLYNDNPKYIINKIKKLISTENLDINSKIDIKEIKMDKIDFPKYILEMSKTMRSRALLKSIVQKIYENSHQSRRRIREDFRYYVRILRNDEEIRNSFEIDDIELKFLREF